MSIQFTFYVLIVEDVWNAAAQAALGPHEGSAELSCSRGEVT